MHTSDESARGEPERSSSLDAPDDDVRCGAIVKKTGLPCRNYPAKGGRCRWHLVDEVVPEDEAEALRQLETAAAQHALDAHHALQGGENGDQDQAFNRNARTAGQLARIRQTLVRPGEFKEGGLEMTQVNVPGNNRDTPAASESSERDRDDGDDAAKPG
jgi:hypothetical protein